MPSAARAYQACGMRLHRPTIVCGVDGSSRTGELVRIAARLADVLDTHLEVVHVLGASSQRPSLASAATTAGSGWAAGNVLTADVNDSELAAVAMLDEVCEAVGARTAGRQVIRYGDPARRLAAIAEGSEALLVVMGSCRDARDRDGLLGSVASRLAADAPCPVLIVASGLEPHVRPEEWRGRTLVAGFDGSAPGWAAACQAATLAEQLDSALIVASVGPGAAVATNDVVLPLQETVSRQRDPNCAATDLTVHHEMRDGDPAWELEAVAAAITAPLIAIGSRGLGPWREPLLGSVARHLLSAARRPILVLPAASLLHGGAA